MIELKNVTYSYPFRKEAALKNVSLTVASGEIVFCTGESGCGKSTLIRLINGLCPHYFGGEMEGKILLDGENTLDKTLGSISCLVGSLFQDPEQQFFALNVEDELSFALEFRGCPPEEIRKRINRTASEFDLNRMLSASVTDMSEGQKQKLGLACLILQEPKIIILDEPTANLDPESALELAEKLRELKKEGYAVLVADHRSYWLKGSADKAVVMSEGEIVESGDFSLLFRKDINEKYGLRNPAAENFRKNHLACDPGGKDICVKAENISFSWKNGKEIFKNASFDIAYGITAVLGRNGTGKTTLARILTGLNKISGGNIYIDGEKPSKDLLLSKVALVLQNADFQLYMRSAFEEVYTSVRLAYKKAPENVNMERTREILSAFGLAHLKDRHPQSLSGGEKQRLTIACAVAKNPRILILDEPTSGLDGANMRRIAGVLKDLEKKGAAILLITHDLELIDMICSSSLTLPVAGRAETIGKAV